MIDSAARMSSHGLVRVLTDRLVATMLVALLAGPGIASFRPCLAGEREASSAQDTGMNAPPGPTVSAAVSVAPVAVPAPLSATARVIVASHPLACGRPTGRALRPAMALKAAPAILRI